MVYLHAGLCFPSPRVGKTGRNGTRRSLDRMAGIVRGVILDLRPGMC